MAVGLNKMQLRMIKNCLNNLDPETLKDNAYIITCLEAVKYCNGNVAILLDYYLDHPEQLEKGLK